MNNNRGREAKSPTGEPCVKRNFSLTPEIFDKLKAESVRSGVPMSQIVRWALEDYFALKVVTS